MARYLLKRIDPVPTRGEISARFVEAPDALAAEAMARCRAGEIWRVVRIVSDDELRQHRAAVIVGPSGA